MTIAVRYYTRSGNTEKLAKAIADKLSVTAETVENPLKEKVDVLFLGSSYYAFDMDANVKQFLKENRELIGKVVCFGTSAMMKSMKKPMRKVAKEIGITIAEEEFHCRGSFGPAHRGRPNEADLNKAKAFAAAFLNK